jgi:hypothetical protein
MIRILIRQEKIIQGFQNNMPSYSFVVLECRQMVGLFQLIIHKSTNNPKDLAVSLVKTGLDGYHGNKVIK